MRISTVGIILLTAMVATKYIVSLDALRAEDGSFKTGIVVDYTTAIDNLLEKNSVIPFDDLLAFNSSTHVTMGDDKSMTAFLTSTNQTPSNSGMPGIRQNNPDEPLPMEHGNSLVVYDFSNPDNNLVSSNFEDTDIEENVPLDNSNTIINGLMLIMPRR